MKARLAKQAADVTVAEGEVAVWRQQLDSFSGIHGAGLRGEQTIDKLIKIFGGGNSREVCKSCLNEFALRRVQRLQFVNG